MNYILILCTTGNEDNAALIARRLVEEKLAACVNVGAASRSVYFWKNEIVQDSEYVLTIKTRSELFERVEARIKELHTYEVPEIIAVEIKAGSREYLDWIDGICYNFQKGGSDENY